MVSEHQLPNFKLVQCSFSASTTMSPDAIDCNSDIDPQASN
jgi:hypothetical protein